MAKIKGKRKQRRTPPPAASAKTPAPSPLPELTPVRPEKPELDAFLESKGIGGKIALVAIEWLPLLLALLFYATLKFYALRPSSSDENIYFYMGWAMVDHGAIPYRDYFFAHPPLQLLIMAGWIASFGFSLASAKAVPWLAFLISGFFFHRLLRTGHSRIASFVGLILYVFAYDVMRASSHFTGINCTIMFLVPAMWALWRHRNATAGVLLSLGALCGTYLMPAGGFALLWVALGRSRKASIRYLLGLSIPYTLATILGMILAGPGKYWDMMYRYHVIKPEQFGEAWKRFLEVSYDNHLLAISMWAGGLFIIASLVVAWASKPLNGLPDLVQRAQEWAFSAPYRVRGLYALGMVFTYLAFLFNLKRVFPFYYLLIFSSMAWLGAYLCEEGVQGARRLIHSLLKNDFSLQGKQLTNIIIAVWVIGLVLGVYALRYKFGESFVPHHLYLHKQRYVWKEAPYLGPVLNQFIKDLTWDDYAEVGEQYNAIRRVMWHETFFLERIYQVAEHVKANTTKEDRVFGDSTSLPLIALLAERRIIDDFADTNIMRFRSGMTNPSKAIRQINRPELKYLIPRWKTGFFRVNEFMNWADRDFILEKKIPERYKGMFLVYRRKGQ